MRSDLGDADLPWHAALVVTRFIGFVWVDCSSADFAGRPAFSPDKSGYYERGLPRRCLLPAVGQGQQGIAGNNAGIPF